MVSASRSVSVSKAATQVRFGDFEYDPSRHELRKGGIRVRIQKQPLAILLTLLESPSSLVTREELRSQLWDSTTFVAFEHGLNSAMKRLRDALCDSADHPRYIETVPGEGYRFIALVESLPVPPSTPVEAAPALVSSASRPELHAVHRMLWLWGAGIAVAAALVVAFAVWRHWSPPAKRGLNFQARDWVLITNFENRTGEPLLDGTLEYALERELSNSQYVNVVPRKRVDDALRLMRKPLDTKIDASLGREICLRDGEIPALLTGRVEKLGSTYVLSASLVDPSRGVTVASLSEEDPAENQMAAAVRRLSNRIREVLGEEHGLIQQSNDRLEKVTTPSLHALQLYTQADQASRMESRGTAAELLERALEEDPDFASAHLLLGYAYLASGNEATGVPHFQRAFELADSAPDRERFFIRGAYYDEVSKDPQEAVEAYETLLRIYPDHFWGTNNLMRLYAALGRTDDACKLWIRAANMSPTDLEANATAAWTKAIVQQDVNGAGFYLGRASKLATEEGDHADPIVTTWLKLFPVYESWLQGNVQSAHAQLIQVEEASNDLDPEELGFSHLDFGELREAERYFHSDPDADWFADANGFLLFIKGDWPSLKKHLPRERNVSGPGSSASIFMARAGMWPEVEKSIKDAGPGRRSTITEGELALARGHTDEGVSLLEGGLKSRLSWPGSAFFLGSESLARTYEKQGKPGETLRVLQQASAEKGRTYPNPLTGAGSIASLWMKTQIQLADLYRELGRVPEAKKIEDELSKLLVYADSDHPILRALKERQHLREARGGQ